MSFRRWLSLGLCCTMLLSSTEVEAIIASVKSYGMGGVGVAYPQDSLAGAYNPAGIVNVEPRYDVGGHYIHQEPICDVNSSTLLNANGTFHGSLGRDFITPDFGFCWMLFDSVDVALGCVGYTREHWRASYPNIFPAMGTDSPVMMEYWQGCISPIIALRFDKLSVGMSFDYIGQTLKAEGLQNFDVTGASISPGAVTNRKVSFADGYAFTLGATYSPTRCLTLGGIYQGVGRNRRFNSYRGLIYGNGKIQCPQRWVVGFHYHRPNNPYSFGGDIEHLSWSDVKAFHNPGPTSNLGLEGAPFGGQKGPGFGWNDQFIAHLGADCKMAEGFTMRVGYRYSQDLVESSQTFMNLLLSNVVTQLVTVGFTAWVGECSELSGYIGYGWRPTIEGKAIGDDFGGGTYDLTNQTAHAGLSVGWYW